MWDCVPLLRQCAKHRALQEGRRVHSKLVASGWASDKFIGNLLVQMYGKCGSIADAREAFDNTRQRNVFSWNILITAYAQNRHLDHACQLLYVAPQWDLYSWTVLLTSQAEHGNLEDAKIIFDAMPEKSAVAWTVVLTSYARNGHLLEACNAFKEIPQRDAIAWNAIIAVFFQNGDLQRAWETFELMPQRDLISWNTLIAAFARDGEVQRAKDLFDSMEQRDVISWNSMLQAYVEVGDSVTACCFFDEMPIRSSSSWNVLLQVCSLTRDLDAAEAVYKKVPQRDCVTSNSMLQVYTEGCKFEDAKKLFDSMPQRNVVSWTSLVAACVEQRHLQEAKNMFEAMPQWNAVAWTVVLLAYAQQKNIAEAKRLFELMPERDIQSWNAMIIAYAQNGDLEAAKRLFEGMQRLDIGSWNAILQACAQNGHFDEAFSVFTCMPQRCILSWNTMVVALAQSGQSRKALELFAKMDLEGPAPDNVSFASVLDACARLELLEEGRVVHAELKSCGIQPDAVVLTSLVNLYGKCGNPEEACMAFEGMIERDVASWNAMLVALWRNKLPKKALILFGRMDLEGIQPDSITYVVILDVCAGISALDKGRIIHECVVASQPSCSTSTLLMNTALINMYGRCGNVPEARLIFEGMPRRDAAAWNSIILQECGEASLQLLQRMDIEGDCPDEVACSSVLDSCGMMNNVDHGKMVHSDAVDAGIVLSECMGAALINMYGRCGQMEEAEKVFHEMSHQDTAAWNCMLAAGARNGQNIWVMNMFRTMIISGIQPDDATFTAVLSACSHAGTIQDAWDCFVSIFADHGVLHTVHQFTCMVDALGRVGQLEKAEELIQKMPFEPLSVAWTSMLGACQSIGCMQHAENAAMSVLQLEPKRSSLYVLLYNILVIPKEDTC